MTRIGRPQGGPAVEAVHVRCRRRDPVRLHRPCMSSARPMIPVKPSNPLEVGQGGWTAAARVITGLVQPVSPVQPISIAHRVVGAVVAPYTRERAKGLDRLDAPAPRLVLRLDRVGRKVGQGWTLRTRISHMPRSMPARLSATVAFYPPRCPAQQGQLTPDCSRDRPPARAIELFELRHATGNVADGGTEHAPVKGSRHTRGISSSAIAFQPRAERWHGRSLRDGHTWTDRLIGRQFCHAHDDAEACRQICKKIIHHCA